jgi:hypothetical protein
MNTQVLIYLILLYCCFVVNAVFSFKVLEQTEGSYLFHSLAVVAGWRQLLADTQVDFVCEGLQPPQIAIHRIITLLIPQIDIIIIGFYENSMEQHKARINHIFWGTYITKISSWQLLFHVLSSVVPLEQIINLWIWHLRSMVRLYSISDRTPVIDSLLVSSLEVCILWIQTYHGKTIKWNKTRQQQRINQNTSKGAQGWSILHYTLLWILKKI